ncbi:hypothetical protein RBSH_01345 [Rhodopirellula baltica SH28]|uniref:Uncharacterized protein n=1 Tax=Rhodopirellula baltica SH28 TaxID=993517 RepID=K5D981_RHOBT|nr:hypothetical protein RBSH_01345 [Rhodopirellula baltica SH28]
MRSGRDFWFAVCRIRIGIGVEIEEIGPFVLPFRALRVLRGFKICYDNLTIDSSTSVVPAWKAVR